MAEAQGVTLSMRLACHVTDGGSADEINSEITTAVVVVGLHAFTVNVGRLAILERMSERGVSRIAIY